MEAAYLAALPWELLHDPERGVYLASDIRTPVVRKLLNPHPCKPLEVDGPLRILVVDAPSLQDEPGGQGKLDFKSEIERMEEACRLLSAAGEIELLHLPKASPEALRDVLRDEVVHVLHFMGHGAYHEGTGMGALFFLAAGGTKEQVDGEMLGDILAGIPDLRLVVLNSCHTARHAGRLGAPLYHGAASGVIDRTGMPAVVANQHAISDRAAIVFSEVFYGRLAAGDPVDTALSEARLRLRWRTTSEWATPVLFLGAEDGRIFERKRLETTRAITLSPQDPAARSEPLQLGVSSVVGWGREMKDRGKVVCDLTVYFDPTPPPGRFIRDPDWWQEKVLPDLCTFLLESFDESRPLHLDFAAHQSIAFAAGWVLEAKSGLDVRVRQRTGNQTLDWHPEDRSEPEGKLWQDRDDLELSDDGPDVAAVLSISNTEIAPEVRVFMEREGLPVGRIVDATIAEPGQQSVRGGQHALRLAQALVNRLRQRRPHERGGRLHLFGAAPNALLFYLGQLSRSFGRVVLYECPFGVPDSYSRYQKSIELPPPDEVNRLPAGWCDVSPRFHAARGLPTRRLRTRDGSKNQARDLRVPPDRRMSRPMSTSPPALLLLATLVGAMGCGTSTEKIDLASGSRLERSVSGGATIRFCFELQKDEFVELGVEQLGLDVVVFLFGPDDADLFEIDNPTGREGWETVLAVGSVTGEHCLEVRPYADDAEGRFALEVFELRDATEEDRRRGTSAAALGLARRRYDTGDFREAADAFRRALPGLEEFGDAEDVARARWG